MRSLPGTPLTATTRPARKGPINLQCRPLNSSGETACAAAPGAASENNVESKSREGQRSLRERGVFIGELILTVIPRLCKAGALAVLFPVLAHKQKIGNAGA